MLIMAYLELVGLGLVVGSLFVTVYSIYDIDKKVKKITGQKAVTEFAHEDLLAVIKFLEQYKTHNPLTKLLVENYLGIYKLEARDRHLT